MITSFVRPLAFIDVYLKEPRTYYAVMHSRRRGRDLPLRALAGTRPRRRRRPIASHSEDSAASLQIATAVIPLSRNATIRSPTEVRTCANISGLTGRSDLMWSKIFGTSPAGGSTTGRHVKQ